MKNKKEIRKEVLQKRGLISEEEKKLIDEKYLLGL